MSPMRPWPVEEFGFGKLLRMLFFQGPKPLTRSLLPLGQHLPEPANPSMWSISRITACSMPSPTIPGRPAATIAAASISISNAVAACAANGAGLCRHAARRGDRLARRAGGVAPQGRGTRSRSAAGARHRRHGGLAGSAGDTAHLAAGGAGRCRGAEMAAGKPLSRIGGRLHRSGARSRRHLGIAGR